MIVNTAYIYMGGGVAVNPNLFQDGVSNYPVVFISSSISSDGLYLPYKGSAATFSELPLTDFNSLTLSATLKGGPADTTVVKIEFYDAFDRLIETESVTFRNSAGTRTVNIPSSAKIQNAKIKITNTSTIKNVTINSALLS